MLNMQKHTQTQRKSARNAAGKAQGAFFLHALLVAVLLCSGIWVSAAGAASPPMVINSRILKDARGEMLMLELSAKVLPNLFTLPNPERLVIDLPGVQAGVLARSIGTLQGDMVRQARYGRYQTEDLRLVLELTHPLQPENWKLRPASGNWRLFVPLRPAAGTRRAAVLKPRRITGVPVPIARQPRLVESPAALSSRQAAAIMDAGNSLPEFTPPESLPALQGIAAASPRPSVPKFPTVSGTPYRPLIAIDAGHGGKDPGAAGRSGTREKDITLQYALALRDALQATGRYRVLMTRRADYIVSLRGRIAKARAEGASLFISLHADAAQNGEAAGLSVYTLSETASDKEAAALATQENKADIIAGIDLSAESQDVTDILIDLAQRETKNKSIDFAHYLLDSMDGISLLRNPHRQAGFAVLKAPDIPSVLVEMGFLTNRQDEKRLRSAEYRERFVRNMQRGIDLYFTNYPVTRMNASP